MMSFKPAFSLPSFTFIKKLFSFSSLSSIRVVSSAYLKVKIEVAQLCLTLHSPMDCSLPGSSAHEIFQARVLEWVAISFSRGIFPTQGWNSGLLHYRQTLYHLSHQGSQNNRISICTKHFRGTY